MSKNASVIEINGNRYDAVTGQLLGAVKKIAKQVSRPSNALTIDGFVRKSSQRVHQTTQRSSTLMRSVVKKPTKLVSAGANLAKRPKARSFTESPVPASRVRATIKNPKVRRFGYSRGQVASVGEVVQRRPSAAASVSASSAVATVRPLPSVIDGASHYHLERLLDQALLRADAHKQSLSGRVRNPNAWQSIKAAPRWLSIGASLFVVVLLAGFFAWQNIPIVAMRVASTKAHVNASIPAYTPSGFSFKGPINYSQGQVTVNYAAAANNTKSFSLTQKATNYDSSSVADVTLPKNVPVQTSQVNGTTVYIYGPNNDAVWVNHGVQFNISGSAGLNSDQLLRIASSL